MAVDYDLDLSAPNTADGMATALLGLARRGGLLPPETDVAALLGDGVTLRAGMYCRVTSAGREQPWPPPTEEDFGVVTTCWAMFRLDAFRDVKAQQDEMVWLASGLLATLPGDVVLHFQSEVAWLVRREGKLVVSDRGDIWTAERLAMLPTPYERGHLAFSDVPDI